MPDEAAKVFEKCTNEKALVLSGKVTKGYTDQNDLLLVLTFMNYYYSYYFQY